MKRKITKKILIMKMSKHPISLRKLSKEEPETHREIKKNLNSKSKPPLLTPSKPNLQAYGSKKAPINTLNSLQNYSYSYGNHS